MYPISKSKKVVDLLLKGNPKNHSSYKTVLDPIIINRFCTLSASSRMSGNRRSYHHAVSNKRNIDFDMTFDATTDNENRSSIRLDEKNVQIKSFYNTFDASNLLTNRFSNTFATSNVIFLSVYNTFDVSKVYGKALYNISDMPKLLKKESSITLCISHTLNNRYTNIFNTAKIINKRFSNIFDTSNIIAERYFTIYMYARIIENRFFISRAIRRIFRKNFSGTPDMSKLIYNPKYWISAEEEIVDDLILDKIHEMPKCNVLFFPSLLMSKVHHIGT